MSFTYVSIPYTDPDPAVRQLRMEMFWRACARLTRQGHRVLSPMTLEPMLRYDPAIVADWKGWEDYAARMMAGCDRMVILTLPGWDTSTGVAGERKLAGELNVAVEFLDPDQLFQDAA